MNRTSKLAIVSLCSIAAFIVSCSQVAVTGRRQFNLVPESTINSMSAQAYGEFLSANPVSGNAQQTDMVRRIGHRIQAAVEKYCSENGIADRLAGYQWEFNLVEDPSVNAWAMPGGKVVVYTGMLPVAQTETGLAVVMGHEIAHAVARHGAERMTQGLIVEMGGMALSEALTKYPTQTQELFVQSFNLGTQYGVLLPYSRVQEEEADHMGLIFMAMAGYDPREAVSFWQRMAAQGEGQQRPPEFLSTHPAEATRIENLKKLMPTAMGYYEPTTSR